MSAPQVTPAMVEAAIASEHYFTGIDGFVGELSRRHHEGNQTNMTVEQVSDVMDGPLSGLMVCVLVLKNGHLVTGEALLQDLSKPDPERARASARRRAFDKAYDMLVYAERERLAAPPSIQLTASEVQSSHDRVRWAEGLILQLPEDHDGRNSWLLNYGSDAKERQAEWAKRNPNSALLRGEG